MNLSRLSAALLIRAACVLGLMALGVMALSLLVPLPLPVIAAMSIGQGLGALAFLCYLAAITVEIARHDAARRKLEREGRGDPR